jgi:ribosomal-protein-alanine N-acetyltransferase
LRTLQAADLEQVCAIEREWSGTPWSRELFAAELARPETCQWLVLAPSEGPGQAAVAAYGGFWKAVDEAHFTNIAVAAAWRRRGLGLALLKALLGRAKALGCTSATLEVRPSNAAALALYQGQGFEAAAMRPHYYTDDGEDALILWKRGL